MIERWFYLRPNHLHLLDLAIETVNRIIIRYFRPYEHMGGILGCEMENSDLTPPLVYRPIF
jgi:hypothetical protein